MVKSANKSTQVKNIALEHVKARISDAVKSKGTSILGEVRNVEKKGYSAASM